MTREIERPPVQPGEPAPDFTVAAATRDDRFSLADFRGKSPLFLALLRGLYCPFCRRHVVLLGKTAEKLERIGVQTLAVVGSSAESGRLYLRYRPTRCLVGADPELAIHEAYGVPRAPVSPELQGAVESSAADLARELRLTVAAGDAHEAIRRLDGYQVTDNDRADYQRHEGQLTAQFLVGRDGIVRWANVECARDGLAGITKFPTDEEILAAASALSD
jgi:peroxiredoxin